MKKFTKGIAVLLLTAAMATSVGAFAEDADIGGSHVDALSLLAGLDVFDGRTGTVDPQTAVNRAEMAKLIYLSRQEQQKNEVTEVADESMDVEPIDWTSPAIEYVTDRAGKLALLPWTSALTSDTIDLSALTDKDAETVVKLTEAGEINLAFGEKVKAKEIVFGVQEGSAVFTLSQSNDGQTWEKSVSKTVVDKTRGIVRLVNQSGAKAMFYKIGIEPSEGITLDSLIATQDASAEKKLPIPYKGFASGSVVWDPTGTGDFSSGD